MSLNISESYTVGEIPAPVLYTFLDSSGTAINLTGFSVKFQYQPITENGSTVVIREGNLVSPLAGQVEYLWVADDFATEGRYRGQFWVGNLTNRYASPVIYYRIVPGVGTVPNI